MTETTPDGPYESEADLEEETLPHEEEPDETEPEEPADPGEGGDGTEEGE